MVKRIYDEKTVNALIDRIYEAALDQSRWQDVVDGLSEIIPGNHVGLQGVDIAANVSIGALGGRFSDEMVSNYLDYYHAINPWTPAMASAPLGRAASAEALCERGRLIDSEFYNDWLLPQDDIGTGGGIVLFRDSQRLLALAGNIRMKDQEALQDDWLALLDHVASHIQRAFTIHRMLEGQKLSMSYYRQILDQIGNSVFLLDKRGRIVDLNASAEALMREEPPFFLDIDRGLNAFDQTANRALAQSIAAIAAGEPSELPNVIALPTSNGDALVATVVPFETGEPSDNLMSQFGSRAIPVALLTVVDPAKRRDPSAHVLKTIYGLTEAECRLVLALHQGETTAEFAQNRTVSIHTVRNQLKSVFAKTNTTKQSELVRLIGSLSSLH